MEVNRAEYKKSFATTVIILILLGGLIYLYNAKQTEMTEGPKPAASGQGDFPDLETVTVDHFVDGDTVTVHGASGNWTIRFIGCDTPETIKPNAPVQPYGPEASQHTKQRILDFGGIVTLAADGDRFDRFGRRLAMVYLGQGDIRDLVLLNEELIYLGLAEYEPQYNYSREKKERFRAAQEDARQNRRGIWSAP
ncbi:MAG: thermonuclease family protein [Thermoguttaceae bacterium]|nr:thermonuclease family protein [Thermoguttaceae bacterium]